MNSFKRQAKIVVILVGVALILSNIWASAPPVSYAAFPGENGNFVLTLDESGEWDLDTFEVYVMGPDGSNLTPLTDDSDFDFYPAWSPDGQKIAFSSRKEGKFDIYVMDADGSNPTNLTNTPTIDEIFPAWSPDGRKIAISADSDGDFDLFVDTGEDLEIYVMDVDGNKKPKRLTHNKVEDYGPVWSPDGQKIIFSSFRDGNNEIYVMKANGGKQKNLTNNPASDGFWAPALSPDGQKIAFVSDRDGNNEIYVMDADGTNQTNLTNNPDPDELPVWSPDGQKIAFQCKRDDNDEICVMDADGTNQMILTTTSGKVRVFDWQSISHVDDDG